MRRLAILILIGLLMVGCKSQPPTADPFFGRTTIPPPPTGSSTGRADAPAFQAPPVVQASPQAPSITAPPVVQMPGPAAPSAVAASPPQIASPPGIAQSVATPRPTSTLPGTAPAVRPAPTASPVGNAPLYAPPGGSYNYRGASTQGSAPLVPTQPEMRTSVPSVVGVSTSRTIGPSDDRTPRPVDDTLAGGGQGGPKTIVQTIQPRPKDDASGRRIDISDLPKAGDTGADARLIQPIGP